MTAEWFFEDELSRLRWEWVSAMREYAWNRSEASLARVRTSCDAYTKRVAQLRRAAQGIGDAGSQRVSDTAT